MKKNKSKPKPRSFVFVAARFRKSGPMKDKKKRELNKINKEEILNV